MESGDWRYGQAEDDAADTARPTSSPNLWGEDPDPGGASAPWLPAQRSTPPSGYPGQGPTSDYPGGQYEAPGYGHPAHQPLPYSAGPAPAGPRYAPAPAPRYDVPQTSPAYQAPRYDMPGDPPTNGAGPDGPTYGGASRGAQGYGGQRQGGHSYAEPGYGEQGYSGPGYAAPGYPASGYNDPTYDSGLYPTVPHPPDNTATWGDGQITAPMSADRPATAGRADGAHAQLARTDVTDLAESGRSGSDSWSRPSTPARSRITDAEDLSPRRTDPYGEEPAYGPVLGYTAGWYAIPGTLYLVWIITMGSDRRAFVGREFVSSLPWLFAAVVLSLAVAGLLRWAIVGWRAITISFAAAVIGAGVATIAHSLAL